MGRDAWNKSYDDDDDDDDDDTKTLTQSQNVLVRDSLGALLLIVLRAIRLCSVLRLKHERFFALNPVSATYGHQYNHTLLSL